MKINSVLTESINQPSYTALTYMATYRKVFYIHISLNKLRGTR
jgi:hypothetical protein